MQMQHCDLASRCCCSTQGIEDHFLEQWHQKLHTNTTPEDVTICEARLQAPLAFACFAAVPSAAASA